MKKDSSTQICMLSRIIAHAEEMLADKQIPKAEHLTVLTDNTAREMMNQNLLKFGALLVCKHWFRSVTFQMFRAGHSRNKIDQRFGTIAVGLSRARLYHNTSTIIHSFPFDWPSTTSKWILTCIYTYTMVKQ